MDLFPRLIQVTARSDPSLRHTFPPTFPATLFSVAINSPPRWSCQTAMPVREWKPQHGDNLCRDNQGLNFLASRRVWRHLCRWPFKGFQTSRPETQRQEHQRVRPGHAKVSHEHPWWGKRVTKGLVAGWLKRVIEGGEVSLQRDRWIERKWCCIWGTTRRRRKQYQRSVYTQSDHAVPTHVAGANAGRCCGKAGTDAHSGDSYIPFHRSSL